MPAPGRVSTILQANILIAAGVALLIKWLFHISHPHSIPIDVRPSIQQARLVQAHGRYPQALVINPPWYYTILINALITSLGIQYCSIPPVGKDMSCAVQICACFNDPTPDNITRLYQRLVTIVYCTMKGRRQLTTLLMCLARATSAHAKRWGPPGRKRRSGSC